ncbi:MAG: response regulator [Candidatus Solibacter sp.]
MHQSELHVLLIEDNPGDAELVRASLTDAVDATFRLDHVDALLPGLDRLAQGDIDVVLLDLSLPDSSGLSGLNALRTHAPSTPVVLLTGMDSELLAMQAVRGGAQDYLVKGTLQGSALARILQRAVARQKISAAAVPSRATPPTGKVLGFVGVKGGVGTTTIACHLATELKRRTDARVLLVDLDLAGNAAAFLMNVNGRYGILDATSEILNLDEDRWGKLTVAGQGGVDVIQSGGPVSLETNQGKAERARFVLRFVRSLYEFIIVDLGRLTPFSARLAADVGDLRLVSTCDMLALNEAKAAIGMLCESGFDRPTLSLILNEASTGACVPRSDLEKFLAVRVDAMLPECRQDFENSSLDGKRLGQSRKFQKQIAELAAMLGGLEQEQPVKTGWSPFRIGGLRNAAADR